MQYYKNLVSFWLNHPNSLNNGLQFKASRISKPANLVSAEPSKTGVRGIVPSNYNSSPPLWRGMPLLPSPRESSDVQCGCTLDQPSSTVGCDRHCLASKALSAAELYLSVVVSVSDD